MSTQLKPIRVLIVDDHPLLRDGIASLIGAEPDMELVAQAANGREGLAQFKLKRPDVTLMDLQMPDVGGIEAIIAIRCEFPNARGARAYLLKGRVNPGGAGYHRDLHLAEVARSNGRGSGGFFTKGPLRRGRHSSITVLKTNNLM